MSAGFSLVARMKGGANEKEVRFWIGSSARILAPFTLSSTFMEKGTTCSESNLNPYGSFHNDLQDLKMGLKTFDDLRLAWVKWAREAIKELEDQADKACNAESLPDTKAADTTA